MRPEFPKTRWSVVAAVAAGGDPSAAGAALGELCQTYWYPLYCFARRKGLSPQDAEDATQAFFAQALASNLFTAADPQLGRLRSFLLQAFTRDLADAHRSAGRLKRGGGAEILSLDREEAEGRYQAEPPDTEPVHQFESTWASAVLDGALRRVEADYTDSGRGPLFAALRPFLGVGAAPALDPLQLAASLGMSDVAFRQALSRFRDRFRSALRAQIADTLREPTDEAIDEELRSLRRVLAGDPS